MDDLIQQGINAYQSGDRENARKLLIAAVKQFPDDERSWGWLYNVCNSDNERIQCVKQVLRINPKNEKARQLLNTITGVKLAKQPPVQNIITEQFLKTQAQNNNIALNGIDALRPISRIGLKPCPFCGKEIPVNSVICKYCGQAVIEPVKNTTVNQSPVKSPAIGQSVPTTSGMSKNTKIILWALGIFVFLLVLIGLSQNNSTSVQSGQSGQSGYHVVYEVVGTAGGVDVTYENPMGGTSQESERALPWSRGWNNVQSGTFLYLSAQNDTDSGSLTCNLYVDGTLVRTTTSSGAYVICDVSGKL